MGGRASRQASHALDQRTWGRGPTHLCRHEAAQRPSCCLPAAARHRPRRHGHAHPEASPRVVDFHAGPPQAGCRGHSRHPHAHEEGHHLPQRARIGEGHHLRRRRLCAFADHRGTARESHRPVGHRRGTRCRQALSRPGGLLPFLERRDCYGSRLPAPCPREHQRRHHAPLLHQRHLRRAEDGRPRLSLSAGPPHHRCLRAGERPSGEKSTDNG